MAQPLGGCAPNEAPDPRSLVLSGKSDVAELKTGVAGIKSDVSRLDGKIDGVRTGLKADFNRLAVEQSKMSGGMRDMEGRLTSRMDSGFARITGRISAFLDRLETYGRETFSIPKTLDAHG